MGRSNLVVAAIANLGTAICQIAGEKNPKHEWFNPVARLQARQEARELVDRRSARIVLELEAEGKIPQLALNELDLELIRLATD
ncbi:hypothetical protein [Pseudanabaena sp. PCC 6802]|uniref:hypothetical protein n=1 Tax=Pseudanabaena sp. PCC 6802 TaxID=118173 RepID=UPI000345E47B|nr:hypothetical protein [Pseudanabaena sp. PCC 6802]